MYQSDIYEYLKSLDTQFNTPLLISKNDLESKSISYIASLLKIESFVLPDIRVSYGDDLRTYQDDIFELLSSLYTYYHSKSSRKLLISPIRTLLLNLPKKEYFDSLDIEFATSLNLNELKSKLYRWGYRVVDIASARGEVSFRGDIIDIYPINSKLPYRVSLFDDEVESIREYNPNTQKSIVDELEKFTIIPAFLALDEDEFASLNQRVEVSNFDIFSRDINSVGLWCLEDLAHNYIDKFTSIFTSNMSSELEEIYSLDTPIISQDKFSLPTIPKAKEFRDIEVANINKILEAHKSKKISIIARNESIVRASNLSSFKNINFIYQDGIVNIMSAKEIILSINKPLKSQRVKRASIVLDEISMGDFVVHENHGVGIFRSVERREVLGAKREFVVISYQNDDTLLVPVENLETIDRFIADGGSVPTLDRLGKVSFKKLKGKVKDKLFAIASNIINISAQRHLKKGIVLDSSKVEIKNFFHKAPFTHTEDQKRAIEDMIEELSSGIMMDRLLSADVGFGKTEVAMNGMFVSFINGYQSMLIVPTTLLSSQHYKSLKERFEHYDIKIAKIDRFSSAKDKKSILASLEDGSIDMVVGTHSLLKAKFKKLALVVIDEEHKFGVKQKEALKEMAINVHLLSMSATPIPRSLNLALSKIKSFSEILTPPTQRQGVRTFVKSYSDKVIKEAILRELRRGGQLFYIHNSIATIEDKRKELLKLLPNLRITILHSKITALKTEDEMIKFENGEYDMMLSTSIVESGIHLPNANSMIVESSDNFGIADLHQLRGRVGRGAKEGYCYFIVEDKEQLSTNAKKRLLALETHSELGSGAVLAFHDLEIRGGGNIIGEAQSGHIKQIGYSLYLKMLEDAIRELSGEVEEKHSVDMKLSINAYINDELIPEDRLRLEIYRRLSQSNNEAQVREIEIEIEDRFGKVDEITRAFIDMIIIKVLARDRGDIAKISSYGENIFIEFVDENRSREVLKSNSKDDDDIIRCAMEYFK
ncbi:Transcription-repair coupling factor [hydrothermal vent metagenome]|uniref:Transcription-repair coupling factor n=1 Tax=hydrothermal vent metagenome TaxID=652676 RepID=A0A1W1EID6_9ZZZZ